jgi:hypothetical protein
MTNFLKCILSSVIAIFIIGGLNQCDTYNFSQIIEIKDISKKYHSEHDTQIERPQYIYVFIEGDVDGDGEIQIRNFQVKPRVHDVIRRFPVKKGNIKISYKEDWYERIFWIDYIPKTSKKGNLKIKIGIN